MLTAGFHATEGGEPRQDRKVATVNRCFRVPWSCLA